MPLMPGSPRNVPLALLVTAVMTCLLADGCRADRIMHHRQVTATAYTLRAAETRPHGHRGIAAWGRDLRRGKPVIAVSRDLLAAGLTRGTRVWIDGLDGTWVVGDKMNRRWHNRIDIFMGDDVERAREWGRRKVTLRWYEKRSD